MNDYESFYPKVVFGKEDHPRVFLKAMSQRKSTLVIYLLKKASHHFITIWSICVCATKLLLFMDPPHMLTCHFSKRAGISIKGYDLACSTRWPYPSHPSVTFTTQISAHFCRNPPLKSNPIVVLEGVPKRTD